MPDDTIVPDVLEIFVCPHCLGAQAARARAALSVLTDPDAEVADLAVAHDELLAAAKLLALPR
jgi:hypothetical protein